MVKRFILGFLVIMLYMGLYALIMLAYMNFIMGGLSGESLAIGNTIVFGGAFFFFFPWFFWTTSLVWFFKAEGVPVPLDSLKKEILAINSYNVPVTVTEDKNGNFRITWRYLDAKWWELFAKASVTQTYELLVKFNDAKKEVRLIDIQKSVSWRAGPTDLRFGFSFFRGIVFDFEIGKAWGIKENFELGKIYDYRFTPGEIKTPVMNTILKRGWNVRFALY